MRFAFRYHPSTRNGAFSVGLDQIRKEDVPLVKNKIEKTFQEIVAE